MTAEFQEFEAAPIAAARFVLADGRSFVFAAYEDEAGLHFTATDGGPGMTSLDLEDMLEFQKIDGLGRIVQAIRRDVRQPA